MMIKTRQNVCSIFYLNLLQHLKLAITLETSLIQDGTSLKLCASGFISMINSAWEQSAEENREVTKTAAF